MVEARQLTACILGEGEGIRSSLEQALQQLPEWSCTITSEQTASAAEPADVVLLILSSSAADDPTISLLTASAAIGDTPIVAVLATEDEYLAANTLAAGAADFLCTENLTISVLRHAIARVVSPSRQQPDASDPKAHEKLASSHATLERWAAELEIANARLREVDDLKTKFLSEVSHEIRTPLAAIVSAAKIITKHHESKPEVVDRFGQTILSEGERLTRLINEFLDLTKIEADCVEWQDAEIDTALLCDDVIGSLSSLAMDKSIDLTFDVGEDLPCSVADHDRVIQVLANLVNNALKYTPENGTICLNVGDHDGAMLFEVKDSGPGIPEDDLGKVFDRFHQVRNTKAVGSEQRGTGLGLCICREIVEHYGGRIWVESEEGHGSSFKFTIPAATPLTPRMVKETNKERSGAVYAARVLALIGDDALSARATSLSAETGIDCRAAQTPEEAIEILCNWRADVAVVASAFIEQYGDELIEQMQAQGVAHILLYSPEIGFAYVGALESSDTIARSIASLAPGAEKVLVVEDDAEYRSLLEFQLKEAGYTVLAADNGRDGLDIIRAERPDAVLLDIIMPVLDGISVLEELQREGIDVPVAVLTGMDDSRVAVAARELGARSVFRKDSAEEAPYRTVIARIQRVFASVLPISAGREGASLSS
jgi:signal transduction histidine kinase/ActR/RegA family two-component response regulator